MVHTYDACCVLLHGDPPPAPPLVVWWLLGGAHTCRLMPGVDVRTMLLRNPSVLFQVQRGTKQLGPPAEVPMMGQQSQPYIQPGHSEYYL